MLFKCWFVIPSSNGGGAGSLGPDHEVIDELPHIS